MATDCINRQVYDSNDVAVVADWSRSGTCDRSYRVRSLSSDVTEDSRCRVGQSRIKALELACCGNLERGVTALVSSFSLDQDSTSWSSRRIARATSMYSVNKKITSNDSTS
ncbi:hypothetical protein TNCV_1108561 [Trichonephila clavipes]|nr:hypothetical protein TNCV_1108561 [Trichonephila clavipes]